MDPITVSIGAESSGWMIALVTSAMPAAVAAGAALGGVWLTNRFTAQVRIEEQRVRQSERTEERRSAETQAKGLRAYEIYLVASHLEDFAFRCAVVVSNNCDLASEGTFQPPPWKAWPEVEWRMLGASTSAKVKDFSLSQTLRMTELSAAFDQIGAHQEADLREYSSQTAAILGLEAWQLAERLRQEAELEPFQFPDKGWRFTKTMSDFLSEV